MSFELFIGRRYLRARENQAFVSLITILSIAGVAVGVMALIVVIAVMTGFESDLKSRILGGQAHVVVRYSGAFSDYRRVLEYVENIDGVEAATPFVYTQIMLRSSSGVSGAVLRGIDPETAGKVLKSLKNVSLTSMPDGSGNSKKNKVPIPGIILGKELARALNVIKGETVYLISPSGMISPMGHMPAMKRFQVTGFFESGMYEYDGTFAYVHLKDAQKILRMEDTVTGLEVRVQDIYKAGDIAEKIIAGLGFPYWARDWMRMNKNLFTALKLEKIVMFIILILIVLVAAFNIASTLIMMVMGKTRDIAILKAMGATDKSIRNIFVFKGMVIGSIGTVIGGCLGFLLCLFLKNYNIHELTGDIYYFTTKLPVRIELFDIISIVAVTLIICFVATLYPAYYASRFDPVEGIRYG